MSSVQNLTSIDQLSDGKRVCQLGSKDEGYATVIYGLNKYDDEKTYKTIKVELSVKDERLIAAFDKDNEDLVDILKGDDNGRSTVSVKVSSKTILSGSIISLEELEPGMEIQLIVRPISWKMGDQKGISLRCVALKVVEEIFEFNE